MQMNRLIILRIFSLRCAQLPEMIVMGLMRSSLKR